MDADQMTLELTQDAPRRSMHRLVLPLRVLVACEYSGTVRDAFAARGHDAMSCDILPTDKPGKHYQGDVPARKSERTPQTIGAIPLSGMPVPARAWDYPILQSHSAVPPVLQIIGGLMIAIHAQGIAVTRGEWGECLKFPP
jgi:hypothetical protein